MGYITIPGISFFSCFFWLWTKACLAFNPSKTIYEGKKVFFSKEKWLVSEYWIIGLDLDEPLIPPAHPANISSDIVLYWYTICKKYNPNTTPICACWAFHVKNWHHSDTRASVRSCTAMSGSHSCSNSFQICSGKFRSGFCTGQSSFNQWLNYFLLCSGGLSCWNGKGSCPKHCHKVGHAQFSRVSLYTAALRLVFNGIKVPCQTVN